MFVVRDYGGVLSTGIHDLLLCKVGFLQVVRDRNW